ncbi:hypothetical protein BLNAU_14794 [Blattamonas nauphoetae]|uniref:Uncharacterized protein n=1 Tax=Blattamonas nauphoetae TaxID=2049346 RepID=A0ABQ9XCR2_9EUKA|nr:hypothetical protein BLNAU_14794 [Blattamonas nauphoetae]
MVVRLSLMIDSNNLSEVTSSRLKSHSRMSRSVSLAVQISTLFIATCSSGGIEWCGFVQVSFWQASFCLQHDVYLLKLYGINAERIIGQHWDGDNNWEIVVVVCSDCWEHNVVKPRNVAICDCGRRELSGEFDLYH